MTTHARVTLLSGLIISALLLTGCDNSDNQQPHAQAPQVTVHVVNSAPLSVTTELPGRTSAFRVAEVRPQVSGIILKRNFVEGSDVEAGQSLYQIDPATYQAAWNSAKGDEAKAEAAAAIAHLTVKRYVPLWVLNISASRNTIRQWPPPARPMPMSSPPKLPWKRPVSTWPTPK